MASVQRNCIHTGDCFDVLDDLPDESVHAVVTDPPYGLAFMGRDWDDFDPKEYQQFCERWATACKRVLKPGGHLLAFSGNRTHHRAFAGVEDAGFEIRDTLTWHYGSGFPKASDIGKTMDKRGGRVVKGVGPIVQEARENAGLSTRELAAEFADEGQEPTGCVWNWENGASNPTVENFNKLVDLLDLPLEKIEPGERDVVGESNQEAMTGDVYGEDTDLTGGFEITEPATDAAKKWDGWKTGLKPATEYIVMARKPFDGATVDCVLENGTGALNIDATRIGTEERENSPAGSPNLPGDERTDSGKGMFDGTGTDEPTTVEGRYPSNVVFDEAEAERLDRQVGDTSDGGNPGEGYGVPDEKLYGDGRSGGASSYQDSGGPSRYFYTSKASKAERTENGQIENAHPTVKPQDLMEWLVKLVTREGQVVLDPFAGSGTTCKAAKATGRAFVGVEKQAQWADVARVRCGLTPDDPATVRKREDQSGLEAYQ